MNAAAKRYGSQCVVVAIDARANAEMSSGFEVYVAQAAALTSRTRLRGRKEFTSAARVRILLTSLDKDGASPL